jgi:hypothetical protein
MATCDTCGTHILFGGVKVGDSRYCNQNCASKDAWKDLMKLVPEAEVERELRAVHQGNCPRCNGPGPVDIHVSHKVYSALVFTRWSSHPIMACRSCGRSQQIKHAVFSSLLGWWGFPWGFLLTPVQVAKNLGGILGMTSPSPETPSPALTRAVHRTLAARRQSASAPAGGQRVEKL